MPTARETKDVRLNAIREILDGEMLRSQGELVARLERQGFSVTQSSVSRDLRDLRVAKVGGVYRLPAVSETGPRVEDVLPALVVAAETAGPNLVVLRTVVGGASQAGLALDQAGWREVVGTVAGDDTLFVATRSRRDQSRVMQRVTSLTQKETEHG